MILDADKFMPPIRLKYTNEAGKTGFLPAMQIYPCQLEGGVIGEETGFFFCKDGFAREVRPMQSVSLFWVAKTRFHRCK